MIFFSSAEWDKPGCLSSRAIACTGLLTSEQDGYSVLGIANAKLRHDDYVLTAGRQYLDLPYVNRSDSRMTPNTFESVTLRYDVPII